MQFQPKRCVYNDKLKLHYGPVYQGQYGQYPVVTYQDRPLITNYLERLETLLHRVIQLNSRTLAIRIDLRFPLHYQLTQEVDQSNEVMTRFFRYLNNELQSAGTKYSTQLHYAWSREKHNSTKPHYHLLMLLNGDAFNSLGDMHSSPSGYYDKANLYHRIVRSWAKAIHWPLDQMEGLVHVPQDRVLRQLFVRHLHRHDNAAFQEVFFAGSYLCKEYSKELNRSFATFTTSRVQGG